MATIDCSGASVRTFHLAPSSTENTYLLDADHQYALHHTGLVSGASATPAADTNNVFGVCSPNATAAASVTADTTEGSNRFILVPSSHVAIGPGVNSVALKTASATPTAVQLIRGPAFLNEH